MLRRQKPDPSAEEAPTRRLLIAAADEEARETYAALLRAAGYDSVRCALGQVVAMVAQNDVGCVVLVGTGGEESSALKAVDDLRQSDQKPVRRTGALLLVSTARNRIFAWETGIDGFVQMPAHLDQITGEIEAILARPRRERTEHRREMIEQSRNA